MKWSMPQNFSAVWYRGYSCQRTDRSCDTKALLEKVKDAKQYDC